MNIADALATLLDVVAKDRDAGCAQLLGEARAAADALQVAARDAGRRRLRDALLLARAEAKARTEASRAKLEGERRRSAHRLASLALAAAEAQLPGALRDLWADPAWRRRWLEQALVRAARSLPRDAWRIRHASGLSEADQAFLRQRLGELGVAAVGCAADPELDAGIEIRFGNARLDATLSGLLGDRNWVQGRFLHLLEAAGAGPSQGGAVKTPEPLSGEPSSPPALGRGPGGG